MIAMPIGHASTADGVLAMVPTLISRILDGYQQTQQSQPADSTSADQTMYQSVVSEVPSLVNDVSELDDQISSAYVMEEDLRLSALDAPQTSAALPMDHQGSAEEWKAPPASDGDQWASGPLDDGWLLDFVEPF